MYYNITHEKITIYYFIWEVIDKITKKNQNVVEAEDWTYAHWRPVCFRSLKD